MRKNYNSSHPSFIAARPYVPKTLAPGAPVAISRPLLNNKSYHDAFSDAHGLTVGEAIQRGLVTLTNEPPAPVQPLDQGSNKGAPDGTKG
jgi:hypothetical protein